MTHKNIDNSGEQDYQGKLVDIAKRIRNWTGHIVIAAHIDPDGDALGSCLALARALQSLNLPKHQSVQIVSEAPAYLTFICTDSDNILTELAQLPENTLLIALDVAEKGRLAGLDHEQATYFINIDHHGTNDRFGDIALVEPNKAATAQIVKDLIPHLEVAWNSHIATPCMMGLITDTGNFRFANTSPEVLRDASDLLGHDIDYAQLTDRLQWRQPSYFKVLAEVLATIEFHHQGKIVSAYIDDDMRERAGPDDSDDYVGLIRYAEGSQLAIFLKQRGTDVKASLRSRGEVSAQRVCLALGGGGHKAAAGATLAGVGIEEARAIVVAEATKEIEAHAQ